MPTIGMAFYIHYMLFVKVHPGFPVFVLLTMFACTCLFPLLGIFLMKSSKMITSVHMPTKEERKWPLLMGTFFFFLAYILIKQVTEKFSGTDGLKDIAVAGIATMIICTVINLLYKLSIHMAAIGGITGMMVAYAPNADTNMLYVILAMVFASGLVGFARLQLSAHSAGQVAAGYAVGFVSQYVLISFLSAQIIKGI